MQLDIRKQPRRYNSKNSDPSMRPPPQDWGVAHGDDVMYLSKLSMKGQPLGQSEEDKRMVDIYRKLITNFIR